MDEIHTPALMRALRLRDRASMHTHVFTTTHPHADLQAFMAIPAIHALLVHRPAFTTQHDMDAQIAKSRPGMCNLANPQTQCRLIPSHALGIPTSMRELSELDRP